MKSGVQLPERFPGAFQTRGIESESLQNNDLRRHSWLWSFKRGEHSANRQIAEGQQKHGYYINETTGAFSKLNSTYGLHKTNVDKLGRTVGKFKEKPINNLCQTNKLD